MKLQIFLFCNWKKVILALLLQACSVNFEMLIAIIPLGPTNPYIGAINTHLTALRVLKWKANSEVSQATKNHFFYNRQLFKY